MLFNSGLLTNQSLQAEKIKSSPPRSLNGVLTSKNITKLYLFLQLSHLMSTLHLISANICFIYNTPKKSHYIKQNTKHTLKMVQISDLLNHSTFFNSIVNMFCNHTNYGLNVVETYYMLLVRWF
jgi:hypothetical protein